MTDTHRINLADFQKMVRTPLTESHVEADHQWRFQQLKSTFNKDLKLAGKYCYHPFNTVTIDSRGECYVCTCQAWLPISVGNILDFNSLQEIVQSPRAREIQASIIDGTYRYCDDKTCHILNSKELSGKIEHRQDNINWIVFAIDESCNLSCPSCRTELIYHNKGEDFEHRMRISDHLVTLIQNHDNFLKFTLSGDGDPFASNVYRNLLEKLQIEPNGNTEIEIVTNGVLIKSHWERMQGIHHSVIRFKISFDAGSAQTYTQTRRGGDWNKLIENCRYIIDWKRQNHAKMEIVANFVVQTSNYQDILNFAQICKDLEFDEINFQKVVDWGKWQQGQVNFFTEHAVWMSSHPKHNDLVRILNDPALVDKRIQLNNLSYLRNTQAKLSDLVTIQQHINETMQTTDIRSAIHSHQHAAEKITDMPGPHRSQTKIIINDTVQLLRQLDTIQSSVIQMANDIQTAIDDITADYHSRGYKINGSYATNRTTVEVERGLREMLVHEETKQTILGVIGQYADWKYPGLEIGPGDGQWTQHLVACEPLYLVDIHEEFLTATKNSFNERFHNKLCCYVTKETDLSMLPQNQFGFVFSWNTFNFLTSDLVKQYLEQIFAVLRPGGVSMFSYNNAERPHCAAMVEIGFMSYLPKTLLCKLALAQGFEILKTVDLEQAVSWIEIKKPGELHTIKLQPPIGHIGRN